MLSRVTPISFPTSASRIPLEVGSLHFVGIGGIGMSGLAEICLSLGYKVQGSDMAEGGNVERLRKKGVMVNIGHTAENVAGVGAVVISSAVKADNLEVVEARRLEIPVVRRAEMLAELMRLKASIAIAGTHGKTTTTTMMATLLDEAKMDPTVINGGIINSYGTNVKLGKGEWMVVEADESDGTFVKIPSTIAVITNIDPEHLDHWGSFDNLKAAFRSFVENIPFYGLAVLCSDDPEVQELASSVTDRRIITYGLNPQADVRAVNIRYEGNGSVYDIEVRVNTAGTLYETTISDVRLTVPGVHNVVNSLAATAVAISMGVKPDVIRRAFGNFNGVKRRFTITGEVAGITFVDDYGHHPAEIAATLSAARNIADSRGSKVIAVFQPHRFTRVRDLFQEFCTCFNSADSVIVADIYTAGEQPIEGISRDSLVEGLKSYRHRNVIALEDLENLPNLIAENATNGDLVVFLGAGSITYWANEMPEKFSNHMKHKKVA
jgi:UDP-N-acetylmuramate--alanine ligase